MKKNVLDVKPNRRPRCQKAAQRACDYCQRRKIRCLPATPGTAPGTTSARCKACAGKEQRCTFDNPTRRNAKFKRKSGGCMSSKSTAQAAVTKAMTTTNTTAATLNRARPKDIAVVAPCVASDHQLPSPPPSSAVSEPASSCANTIEDPALAGLPKHPLDHPLPPVDQETMEVLEASLTYRQARFRDVTDRERGLILNSFLMLPQPMLDPGLLCHLCCVAHHLEFRFIVHTVCSGLGFWLTLNRTMLAMAPSPTTEETAAPTPHSDGGSRRHRRSFSSSSTASNFSTSSSFSTSSLHSDDHLPCDATIRHYATAVELIPKLDPVSSPPVVGEAMDMLNSHILTWVKQFTHLA